MPKFQPRLAALAIAGVLVAPSAHAAQTLFSQDFSGGLGANESVSGNFHVANGAVGHTTGATYGANETSYYQVNLDLKQLTSAFLTFDWTAVTEKGFDGWHIQVTTGDFVPYNPVIDAMSPIYTGNYGFGRGFTGTGGGTSTLDLSDYLGEVVKLRFRFQSDWAAQYAGVRFDNLTLTGTTGPIAAVPEPASWAMMILGFGLTGALLRRRSRQAVTLA